MKVIAVAAIAAILIGSATPGVAFASDTRITVQPAVWSSAKEMEALHSKIRRMAREMCRVPGADLRSVAACIEETESATMMQSGMPVLISHYQDCKQARAGKGLFFWTRAKHRRTEQARAVEAAAIRP